MTLRPGKLPPAALQALLAALPADPSLLLGPGVGRDAAIIDLGDRVLVAVNLLDEARRKGIEVDIRTLSRDLGVPVVGIVARTGEGLQALLTAVDALTSGSLDTRPLRVRGTEEFQRAVAELVPLIEAAAPGVPNARWIAIRLLDGDAEVEDALASGRLAQLVTDQQQSAERFSAKIALEGAQ